MSTDELGATYRCRACERSYPATKNAPWRCQCGHALDFDWSVTETDGPPETLDREAGLWAFEALLPVDQRVTLGEGWTPLVDAPERAATYKLDWLFPTGSFKDRGGAVTLSHALELGVECVVEDSSGNAGAAIATYAARAGIDAEIFVPAEAKPGKLRAIERTGATLHPVEGTRLDVTDACIEAVEGDVETADESDAAGVETGNSAESGGWYASHAWNPAFFEGTATFAYESAAQRGWSVPDAVVTPLGHGTLFLGAYRGFKRLYDAGWTDRMPRLYGAQAAGVAPVVGDILGPEAAAGENDLADGIQIRNPARREQILAAVEDSGGDVVAIDEAETEAVYDELHRQGLYVEPTAAVAPAAFDRLRATGDIEADEDVVVALTGSGLKT